MAGQPRRVRVPGEQNRNVYRRPDGKFEIGFRDSTGKQRWRGVEGGITAARAERDAVLGARGKGERVQPNPKLRFGDVADRWLAEQVAELRPATRAIYRNAVVNHLKPRWERRRMDAIGVDDAAKLVRDLRSEGLAEWTISGVLKAAARVFKFAQRRCSWHGENPVGMLENGERPKVGRTTRRRIFRGDEFGQMLAVAREPFRTLFALAAVTGARESELLGLIVADLDVRDLDAATMTLSHQLDRDGERVELKTDESRRTIELPRSLALMVLEHLARSPHSGREAFVFATRSGRAVSQRNALRELRRAQERARDGEGRPTFPDLFEHDERGHLTVDAKGAFVLRPRKALERGVVPNFHSHRHSAASEAIAAGDSVEEVSWQLGHKNSNVTRSVYVQEVKSAERTARRRAAMETRYGAMLGSAMEATDRSERGDGCVTVHDPATGEPGEVLELRRSGDTRQ